MYHYTYKIYYTTNKFYISVRSSQVPPEEDTKYVGSSKVTPNDCIIRKEILGVFATRDLAVLNEMEHQRFHNVIHNDLYYNMIIQTATKFDVTGTHQSEEHKAKIGNALRGRIRPPEVCEKISQAAKGRKDTKPRSAEHRKKMSDMLKGRPSALKGRKYSEEEKTALYAKRLKYPDKYCWVHKKTGEVHHKTTQEMGILDGTPHAIMHFTQILNGVDKSYHGWKLK